MDDSRCQCKKNHHRQNSDHKGQIAKPSAVCPRCLHLSCAQLNAQDDPACRRHAIAQGADQIPHDGGDGICGSGIRSHVRDDRCVGGEADAPQKCGAQDRCRDLQRIDHQLLPVVQESFQIGPDIILSHRDQNAPCQLDDPRDQCRNSGSFRSECRCPEEAEDQHCVQDDI